LPVCALPTFLSVLAINFAPAAIALLAGGVCWATTLALVAALCSGAVTFLAVSVYVLLNWISGADLPAALVVGGFAALFELALAALFYWRMSSSVADNADGKFWLVVLHDRLHGAPG